MQRLVRRVCCLLFIGWTFPAPAPAFADKAEEMARASIELQTNLLSRRFKEAEPPARRLLALAEGAFRNDPPAQGQQGFLTVPISS